MKRLGLLSVVLAVASLASGCNCGHNVLVESITPGEATATGRSDAGTDGGSGLIRYCGDGVVSPPEECEPVDFEGADPVCHSNCTFTRACPAGQGWNESAKHCTLVDAGSGAEVVGVLTEYTGILPLTSKLHPPKPIGQAIVHLELKGGLGDVSAVTTAPDGAFRFSVTPGVEYQLLYELPAQYEVDPQYVRAIPALGPSETYRADYAFTLKGLHVATQDLKAGGPLAQVSVSIVDEANHVTAGPRLTDDEGYVFFERTATPQRLQFEKRGYAETTLGVPSLNTTHTTYAGIGLQAKP